MLVWSTRAFMLKRLMLLLAVMSVAVSASGCKTSPSYAPYENLPHGPGG
jgi:hypothetical protein